MKTVKLVISMGLGLLVAAAAVTLVTDSRLVLGQCVVLLVVMCAASMLFMALNNRRAA